MKVPLMWRTSHYVHSRATKQLRRESADRRLRTIIAHKCIDNDDRNHHLNGYWPLQPTSMPLISQHRSTTALPILPAGPSSWPWGLPSPATQSMPNICNWMKEGSEPTQHNRERQRPSLVDDVHHRNLRNRNVNCGGRLCSFMQRYRAREHNNFQRRWRGQHTYMMVETGEWRTKQHRQLAANGKVEHTTNKLLEGNLASLYAPAGSRWISKKLM